jgi:hypothetical protein
MAVRNLAVFGIAVIVAASASAQSIMIVEIMRDPDNGCSCGGETEMEWIELHNTTGVPIDINGWTLDDDGPASPEHTISGSLVVPAHGYLVLCGSNDLLATCNPECDYSNGGSSLNFQNSGDDWIILRDDSAVEIDRVEWDANTTCVWPCSVGQSMVFTGTVFDDNNSAANWTDCAATAINNYGACATLYGTPGIKGGQQSVPVTLQSITIEKTSSSDH